MRKMTIMYTPLPNGLTEDGLRLKLSLHVSPRLETDENPPVLGLFPDWLVWPRRLTNGGFSVVFQGGTVLTGQRVSQPSLAVWQALFGPDTPVTTHEFDGLSGRPIRGYPLAHVADYLNDLYRRTIRRSPEEPPNPRTMASELEPLSANARANALLAIDRILADPGQRVLPPGPADPTTDFAQVARFHGRPSGREERPPTENGARPALAGEAPELDFHSAVASLSSYPELQRTFGLVIDLEVPLDPQIRSGLQSTTVRIVPVIGSDPDIEVVSVKPLVQYELDPDNGIFRARTRFAQPEIRDGWLDLSEGDGRPSRVMALDADGGALKLLAHTESLLRVRSDGFHLRDVEDTAMLPALRGDGIAITRAERAHRLALRLDDYVLRNQRVLADIQQPETLALEDVVRGWRFDVWDESTQGWHSLCRRTGNWRILDDADQPLASGLLDDEGFVETGATEDEGELFVHDSLARWAGWSLVAPRPGKAVDASDVPSEPENAPGDDFRLRVDYGASAGTLPRLRYGRRYRFRARVVDLAGNDRGFGDPKAKTFAWASPEIAYRRHDPVTYPTLVPSAAPDRALGEGNERLVLRSAPDVTAAQYAADQSLPPSDTRHLVPPRASQIRCEQHGMFDRPEGLDKAAYGLIVARDGTLADVPGATFVGDAERDLLLPPGDFALPYLSDPIARGVAIRDLPGVPAGEPVVVFWRGEWPDRQPMRLRIEEDLSAGPGQETAPAWDPGTGVLSVYLKKAALLRARISSVLAAEDLDLLEMWAGYVAEGAGNVTPDERQRAREGRFWMLTPYRRVEMVHAVQRPLVQPAPANLAATRTQVGQTDAALAGQVAIHGDSSAKIDVQAAWSEPVDDLSDPGPTTRERGAQVAEPGVARGQDQLELNGEGIRHDFGDTKRRHVGYRFVATTRFREHFPAPPEPADPDHFTQTSAPVAVDVPSSARPAAPEVRYVLPTFRWEDEGMTRRRLAGLRIYLERPWYSSGVGEQLAVLLVDGDIGDIALPGATATPPVVPEALEPYVSRWAADPLWQAPDPAGLTVGAFGNTAGPSEGNLRLAELTAPDGGYDSDLEVRAVPFDVAYDASRRLWFADVDLDAGAAYWPFIRLALARYQAVSVPGVELSRVVLADFAQVAPERQVSLVDLGGNRFRATVGGPSVPAEPSAQVPPRVRFLARLEQTTAADAADPLATWTSVQDVALGPVRGEDPAWSGEFVTRGDPSMAYRLVVRELEVYSEPSTRAVERERLVYADVLTVPFSPRPTPSATTGPTATTAATATSTSTPPWTPAPSRTPAPAPDTPTPGPTVTASPSPTGGTPTPSPTHTPSPTDPPTATPSPTDGPSPTPSATPTDGPSPTPPEVSPTPPDDGTATPTPDGATPGPTPTDDGEDETIYLPSTRKNR